MIVRFATIIGKDSPTDHIKHKNIDYNFVAFLRMEVGNSNAVSIDLAYCLSNLLRRWPIDFPNANRIRQLAMNVLDADFSKSYQRKCLITLERYAQFLLIPTLTVEQAKLHCF